MALLTGLFGKDAEVLRDEAFQLLFLSNTVGVLGTALISPILDSLVGPFRTTATDIGLMISAFSAPVIVNITLSCGLPDRYGRKPLLIAGLLLFGTGGSAIALTTDFGVVLTLRFVQGLGYASLLPIVITSIGDLYDGDEGATAQGLRFMSSGLSRTTFPLLTGFSVVLAWQYPFLLSPSHSPSPRWCIFAWTRR